MKEDSAMQNWERDVLGVRAAEALRHVFMMSECSTQMCLAAFIDVN